ncbi:hypothetical protein MP228_000410 [Amoeboaphelidium protococcarum]|nr:hypothetical protein MP228_000410 [Amoeboaphelidium protococcarum]
MTSGTNKIQFKPSKPIVIKKLEGEQSSSLVESKEKKTSNIHDNNVKASSNDQNLKRKASNDVLQQEEEEGGDSLNGSQQQQHQHYTKDRTKQQKQDGGEDGTSRSSLSDPQSNAATASSSMTSLLNPPLTGQSSAFGQLSMSARTFGSGFTLPSFASPSKVQATSFPHNADKMKLPQQNSEDKQKSSGDSQQQKSTKSIFGQSVGTVSGGFQSVLSGVQNKANSNFDELLKQQDKADNQQSAIGRKSNEGAQFEQRSVHTGEEEEITLLRNRVVIKKYDQEEKEWKQRGQGLVHLNISHKQELRSTAASSKQSPSKQSNKKTPNDASKSSSYKARLIARSLGTMGLILNVAIFEGMSVKKSGDRSLIFGSMADDGQFVTYALRYENKEIVEDWLQMLQQLTQKNGIETVYSQIADDIKNGIQNQHHQQFDDYYYHYDEEAQGNGQQDDEQKDDQEDKSESNASSQQSSSQPSQDGEDDDDDDQEVNESGYRDEDASEDVESMPDSQDGTWDEFVPQKE